MTGMDMVPETLVYFDHLTRLMALAISTEFSRRKSFKAKIISIFILNRRLFAILHVRI
jgi:hypothetical protein